MFEKLKNKFYSIMPAGLYCFYMENIRLTAWKNKYKKHKMDKKYGFNTNEIWELDMSFYKWLQPRLKYFKEVNNGYPNGKTWEGWCNELDDNITKLDLIIKYDDEPWKCPTDYITDKDDKDLNERSYANCRESFNKWFGENVNNLWW